MTTATEELLTVPEVMAVLKLGRSKVYDLIRSRRLVSVRIGRSRRIPVAAVGALVADLIREAG